MPEEETTAKVLVGTSATEAILGAGAIVLAVLGLLDIYPLYMASIATIAVGAALFIEGAGIASRTRELQRVLDEGQRQSAALTGGTSVEIIGGAAGIVLGVLALFGVEPVMMLAIAALVFGGTLLVGAGATRQVDAATSVRGGHSTALHQAMVATDGAKILAGIAVGVLGILVLAEIGASPMTMILAAMLVVGAIGLLSGSAITARLGPILH